MNGTVTDTLEARGVVRVAEARRKVVTILFADIVASSQVVIGRDPESANESLLATLQTMIEAVQSLGGSVTQVLGDGIMAVFGAPASQEDHALRACLAAQRMQAAVAKLAAVGGDAAARVRIGINSGPVLAQEIRPDRWPEYRMAGEAVYIAARLAAAAKPGTTLVTPETVSLAPDAVFAKPGPAVLLSPGMPSVASLVFAEVKLVRGTNLDGAGAAPMVGRARESGLLQEALESARCGHGRTLLIAGDPGIGKSRLVAEFARDARLAGVRTVVSACLPPHLPRASEPIQEIVAGALGYLGARDAAVRSLEGLDTLHAAAGHALLGDTAPVNAWRSLDAAGKRNLMLAAAVHILIAVAVDEPLLLVVEDMHWADSDCGQLLELLTARIHQASILVVLTARTSSEARDLPWPNTRLLPLGPLTAADSSVLIDRVFGEAAPRPLHDLLIAKTEGNPFFLLACAMAMREAAGAAARGAAARGRDWEQDFRVPSSVHSAIAARIDQLSAVEQEVLYRAAVIGQTFDYRLLAKLCGEGQQLLGTLNRLGEAGFVHRTRVIPNLEFSFTHALMHEVAYASLPKALRIDLHRSVLQILRRPSQRHPLNRVALMAYHAYRAQVWGRAYLYGHEAGRIAAAHSRHKEASVLFGEAARALAHARRSPRNDVRTADVLLGLADALLPLGQSEQARGHLDAARVAARRSRDPRVLTSTLCSVLLHSWVTGNLDEAHRVGLRALRSARASGFADLELLATGRLGALAVDRGHFRLAVKYLTEATAASRAESGVMVPGFLVVHPVMFHAPLALALAECGRFDEAIRLADEALSAAEQSGHAFSRVYALLYAGGVYLRKGDSKRGIGLLDQALQTCQAIGSNLLYRRIVSALGYALTLDGNLEAGVSRLEEAIAGATNDPVLCQLSQQLGWLSLALSAAGRVQFAIAAGRRAVAAAQAHGEKGYEAWAWYALGKAQSDADPAAASRSLWQSLWIAGRQGMRPLVAQCTLELGAHLAGSHPAQGNDFVRSAGRDFSRMAMDYWRVQAKGILCMPAGPRRGEQLN